MDRPISLFPRLLNIIEAIVEEYNLRVPDLAFEKAFFQICKMNTLPYLAEVQVPVSGKPSLDCVLRNICRTLGSEGKI